MTEATKASATISPPKGPQVPTTPSSIYQASYKGLKTWFAAIKQRKKGPLVGNEGNRAKLYPKFQVDIFSKIVAQVGNQVGGITFEARTCEVLDEEDETEEGKMALTLGPKQPGGFQAVYFKDIQRCLARVKDFIVRWEGWTEKRDGPTRASVYSTQLCSWEEHPQTKVRSPGEPIFNIQPGDEPLSMYLVLLPKDDIERFGGRGGIMKMPSILDLDPSQIHPLLAELREAGLMGGDPRKLGRMPQAGEE